VARVVISTDGYVGTDGAGWAFVVHGEGHEAVERGVLPDCPSHLAEWCAVERALAWARAALAAGDDLELRTDSALVAKGLARRSPAMSGEAAVKRAGCRQTIAALAREGVKVRVVRVARAANAEADGEARRVGMGTL
jgi:ribonuclease HI